MASRSPTLHSRVAWLLLAGALPGAPASPAALAATAAQPRLATPETHHDFGRVPQGEVARHDFILENRGNAVLEILEVTPSCGCTTAATWTRRIEPGKSGVIPVRFDTASFSGSVSKTILVTTNDAARPQVSLEIKALVWTPVSISDPVVIFPAVGDPAATATRTVTIENAVDGTLTLSDLRCDHPRFNVEIVPRVPGRVFDLKVSTVPPLADGTHTARITIASSNPKMPELSIRAVATVLPPVQVAPTEIRLPATRLPAPEKRHVVLLNHRAAHLEVSDVKSTVEGLEISTRATPDGRQITVTLVFPAGFEPANGAQDAVTGRTNHPSLPTFQVPIVYAAAR